MGLNESTAISEQVCTPVHHLRGELLKEKECNLNCHVCRTKLAVFIQIRNEETGERSRNTEAEVADWKIFISEKNCNKSEGLHKMIQLQETMFVTRVWNFEEYEHIEYIPRITPEHPNSGCHGKTVQHGPMALEEGFFLGLAVILGESLPQLFHLLFSVFLSLLPTANTSGRNDTCMEPSTTPGVLAMTFGSLTQCWQHCWYIKGVQAVSRKDFSSKSWAGIDNCIPFHTFPACHALAHQYASVTSRSSALKGNATFQRAWSISLT